MERAGVVFGALMIAMGMAVSFPAAAEEDLATGAGYGSENLSFDRWCSEIRRLPADQCASHTPDDQAAYDRAKQNISQYEIEHAKEQRKERDFFKQQEAHRTMTPLPNL